MPFKDLLDITEMDYNALLQLIQRLKKDGIIESAGKGLYRVKET
jgi:predicted transcriptional regulator of viral defense system